MDRGRLAARLVRLERQGVPTTDRDARSVLRFLAEESPVRPLPTPGAITAAFRARRCIAHGEWLIVWSAAGLLCRQYAGVDAAAV